MFSGAFGGYWSQKDGGGGRVGQFNVKLELYHVQLNSPYGLNFRKKICHTGEFGPFDWSQRPTSLLMLKA